jgi:hypothetical protein
VISSLAALKALMMLAGVYDQILTVSQDSVQETDHKNGLRLELSVNSTETASGESLDIKLDVFNTLPLANTIKVPDSQPGFTLPIPYCYCGALPPITFGVLEGYYSMNSYTAGSALVQVPPVHSMIAACPIVVQQSFEFKPLSSEADTMSTVGYRLKAITSISFPLSGYWPDGSFKLLHPGMYTVVGENAWEAARAASCECV